MSVLALPTPRLREKLIEQRPDFEPLRSAVVLESFDRPPDGLADVQFWVPGFIDSQPVTPARVRELLPQLQVVQTQSAGVDSFLPLIPPHVRLCDARGVHGSSTSEWALTAMLSVLRKFPVFVRDQERQYWERRMTEELTGKQVLIIGAGDVGEKLRRRVVACEAEPVMVARSARDGVHGLTELPTLLPRADIVVLIVPKTSETIGMVDAAFLAQMKDGALLVNAARGPVVVTDDLLAELTSGRLRAALDVVEPEPLPPDHPLWHAPNLLITPHVGGSVLGLEGRVVQLVLAQFDRFLAGEELINVVSGEY